MNKSEKNFDAGLRVLEVLKVMLNENLKKIELIEKLKNNSVVECVYTQEAFVKYFNTLEALGFELERVKNNYILANALFKIDLSKEEKELLEKLILESKSLYNKNIELNVKTAVNKINKYISPKFTNEQLSNLFDNESKFDSDIVNNNLLLSIKNMIADNLLVKIKFRKNKNLIEETIVELKEIVEKNNKRFVLCYLPDLARNIKINIDSIIELNQLPKKSKGTTCLNSVVFELYGRLVSSYKLKPSEKVINFSNNCITVSNTAEDKDTLLRRLLKYGENCKIITPKSMQNELLDLTNEMLKNLEGNK